MGAEEQKSRCVMGQGSEETPIPNPEAFSKGILQHWDQGTLTAGYLEAQPRDSGIEWALNGQCLTQEVIKDAARACMNDHSHLCATGGQMLAAREKGMFNKALTIFSLTEKKYLLCSITKSIECNLRH